MLGPIFSETFCYNVITDVKVVYNVPSMQYNGCLQKALKGIKGPLSLRAERAAASDGAKYSSLEEPDRG